MIIRPKNRPERNRRERKQRYISAKNMMRKHPECAYNGDFYCDHMYDPQYPWLWIDFRFFHTQLHRYYAACLVTAEYEAWTNAEDRALDLAPDRRSTIFERSSIFEELLVPTKITPRIELKDYGPVAIGLFATVNTPYIDENIIRQFIAHFRSLGEPVTAGWTWRGEEIQVDPRRLKERT